MHGGVALRLENAACEMAEFLRHVRRALGGDGKLRQIGAGFPRQQAQRGDSRMPALGWAHADRGIALQQLDVVVALGDAGDEILHLEIFVEVHEVVPAGVGENGEAVGLAPRPAVARHRRWFGLRGEAGVQSRGPAGAVTLDQHRIQPVCAVDRAGGENMRRQGRGLEHVGGLVVGKTCARVMEELAGRAVARGHAKEIALEGGGGLIGFALRPGSARSRRR